MIGAYPRRTTGPLSATLAAFTALTLAAGLLSAQSTTDLPSLPASPDAAPAVSTGDNPVLPPYSPSNNGASPLLPASPPLAPRPSIALPSLLPDAAPPSSSPPPLPVPDQLGSSLSSPSAGALTNGSAGTTPSTPLAGGADSTNVTGTVRRFQYAFRLTTGVTYDDNLFLSTTRGAIPGTSRDDVLVFIEPSVSLGYGDFLSRATNFVEFDYNLQALLYTKNSDQTTVQHILGLQGAYHLGAVTLSLSQGVQILKSTDISSNSGSLLGSSNNGPNLTNSQVNLDASRRTGLDIFTTAGGVNYALSDKTSVDLSGNFSAYEYDTLISSDTLSGSTFFNYSPTGKLTLGLGASVGYTVQDDPAPDEYFQQINLRLSYAATGKLSASGSVGIQFRETSGSSTSQVTPVFDLTISYAPFDSTSLSLAASRTVSTSAVLIGQDYDSTGFSFTISQRFFQRVYTHLSVGYTHSNYVFSGTGIGTSRTDDYYFVQPGIDYTIRDHVSVGVFYSRRQSYSSLVGNGFSDNQIGARVSLNF